MELALQSQSNWEVWCMDSWQSSFIYSCRKHVWPTSSWSHQVGSWGLRNYRQSVNYPFFQKLRAYCGSWRIWRGSDPLPIGGSTLSCWRRSPGIHPASPRSFSRNRPICWRYTVGCRGGSTIKVHSLSWAAMTLKLIENYDSKRDFCEDRTMSR